MESIRKQKQKKNKYFKSERPRFISVEENRFRLKAYQIRRQGVG